MYKYRALCVKVVDGDTIDAFVDLGFDLWARKRIRLKQTLEKNNYEFILLSHGVGKYGRCLGELFIDDISVNKLLIKEGHAKKYKE